MRPCWTQCPVSFYSQGTWFYFISLRSPLNAPTTRGSSGSLNESQIFFPSGNRRQSNGSGRRTFFQSRRRSSERRTELDRTNLNSRANQLSRETIDSEHSERRISTERHESIPSIIGMSICMLSVSLILRHEFIVLKKNAYLYSCKTCITVDSVEEECISVQLWDMYHSW